MTVGDNVELSAGDFVPADCVVLKCDDHFTVDESMLAGEPKSINKKPLSHYNEVVLSNETIVFATSKIISGNAFAIVLAVGETSSEAMIMKVR